MSIKRTLTTIAVFTGIGTLLYGIYKYYENQFRLAMEYCYKVYDYSILKFNKERITVKLYVKFQNKSSFALNIKSYEFDIYINNKNVGTVKQEKEQMLINEGISSLTLLVDFIPDEVFDIEDAVNLALLYLTDKSKITFRLKGSFNIEMNFIRVKLPLDLSFTLSELISSDVQSDSKKTKCEIK